MLCNTKYCTHTSGGQCHSFVWFSEEYSSHALQHKCFAITSKAWAPAYEHKIISGSFQSTPPLLQGMESGEHKGGVVKRSQGMEVSGSRGGKEGRGEVRGSERGAAEGRGGNGLGKGTEKRGEEGKKGRLESSRKEEDTSEEGGAVGKEMKEAEEGAERKNEAGTASVARGKVKDSEMQGEEGGREGGDASGSAQSEGRIQGQARGEEREEVVFEGFAAQGVVQSSGGVVEKVEV